MGSATRCGAYAIADRTCTVEVRANVSGSAAATRVALTRAIADPFVKLSGVVQLLGYRRLVLLRTRIDLPLASHSAPCRPRASLKYEEYSGVRAWPPRSRIPARSSDQYALGAALARDARRAIAWASVALLLVTVGFAAGCGAECRDEDGDGRGEGCERGPDCDDHDPRRAARCRTIEERCQENPTLEGCPCLADVDPSCYAAPAETRDVGVCHAGFAECSKGKFLACEGATLPTTEVCNQLDDDCDGLADEYVASPCGGCDLKCVGAVWGPPVKAFEASAGLSVTAAGELTLASMARERHFVWVPNTDEGTLSKLDANRAVELARYRTPGARPVRVAVDHRGDVFVLDAPRQGAARLAKFASETERCVDGDGDGLETSHGPAQLLDRDECLLLDVSVGEAGDDAQSLAIDGAQAPDSELAGNAWIGFAAARRVVAYDGNDGRQLRAADLPDFAAYAASFDVWGALWIIDRDGKLARVDPLADPPAVEIVRAQLACYSLESVSIEPAGGLLFAGFGCESVVSYDPRAKRWSDVQVPELLSPRGIALTPNASWVVYTSGQLAQIERDPFGIAKASDLASDGTSPFESVAVAADSGGRLWIVSTQGGPDGRGLATRYDVKEGKVTAQVPVGRGPRAGGDLTGVTLGPEFVRSAGVSHVFDAGCSSSGSGTHWKALHVLGDAGAGASVLIELRHAKTADRLAGSAFVAVGTFPDAATIPLDVPDDGVIEVRITLRSEQAIGAPRIRRVGLEWTCAGPD